MYETSVMAGKNETPKEMDTEGDDVDNGVSLVDVLNEEEKLESDAKAVLGGSDDKNCTYGQGYVGRQALYSCKTCANGREMAGVCLACSLHCHEDHQLYELYTKRFFRCDCGNDKFPDFTCKLSPDKDEVNKNNRYNQNFLGVYCTCSRPYPDPEDDVEDEMIQCALCEDWLHSRHLGVPCPPDHGFHEMVCSDCMKKCDFLWAYQPHCKQICVVKKESNDVNVDVGNDPATPAKDAPSEVSLKSEETKDSAQSSGPCLLEQLQAVDSGHREGSTFWPDGWRSKLCQCPACLELYSTHNVGFLPDEADTVQHYEDKGEASATGSQYNTGMQALSSMNRVQLGEMIHGYNHLKDSLLEYLKKFAENKRVVREEDIREFFGEMEAKKRRRLDDM